MDNDDRLHAHCERHWREMDPNDTLGLLGPQGAADTGAGQNDSPAAPERT